MKQVDLQAFSSLVSQLQKETLIVAKVSQELQNDTHQKCCYPTFYKELRSGGHQKNGRIDTISVGGTVLVQVVIPVLG